MILIEPNTHLSNVDNVGSFDFKEKIYGRIKRTPASYDRRRTIENLRKIGLTINDEKYTKRILNLWRGDL